MALSCRSGFVLFTFKLPLATCDNVTIIAPRHRRGTSVHSIVSATRMATLHVTHNPEEEQAGIVARQ